MLKEHIKSITQVVKALGAEPVPLAGNPADPRSGFDFPTPAHVVEAAKEGVRGLILSSPSNPTGATLSGKELEALATCCLENEVRFISDEIYHHIAYIRRRGSSHSTPAEEYD